MKNEVSFKSTKKEDILISKIAKRAKFMLKSQYNIEIDLQSTMMDLTAVNANGCPIDFERMATASIHDVIHDVMGISKNINRETGKLENCFLPRFTK